jgi:hypothetical protein
LPKRLRLALRAEVANVNTARAFSSEAIRLLWTKWTPLKRETPESDRTLKALLLETTKILPCVVESVPVDMVDDPVFRYVVRTWAHHDTMHRNPLVWWSGVCVHVAQELANELDLILTIYGRGFDAKAKRDDVCHCILSILSR